MEGFPDEKPVQAAQALHEVVLRHSSPTLQSNVLEDDNNNKCYDKEHGRLTSRHFE